MNENDLEKKVQELEKQVEKNTRICNIVVALWSITGLALGILLIWWLATLQI
jgi:hypothetical protein